MSLQLVWDSYLMSVMMNGRWWEQTIPSVIPGFKMQQCKSQESSEIPLPFVQHSPLTAVSGIAATHPIKISQRYSHFHKLLTSVSQDLFLLNLLNKKHQERSVFSVIQELQSSEDRGTCTSSCPSYRQWTDQDPVFRLLQTSLDVLYLQSTPESWCHI